MNLVRIVRRHLKLAVIGDQTYPSDHLFGMKVPKGGSVCSKCKFVSDDKKHCGNEYFQKWQKSMGAEDPSLLPEPGDEYCCDVFATQKTKQASTLRSIAGLPEHVPFQYKFEGLANEKWYPSGYGALPGDDISNHPNNVLANNPFMNRDPLTVRRLLLSGQITDPQLKTAAMEYLKLVSRFTGWDTLGDSSASKF